MGTVVLGTGHYVPPRVVTNHDLAEMMDTSDEWIQQRTGIVERHWADDDVGASDLAYEAAVRALDQAGLEAADIDCLLFATLSPDYPMPGCGVLLANRLGIADRGIPAIDLRNQCCGYLYAVQIADAFIRQGLYKRILVAGAEVHSSGLDRTSRGRDVTVLFGDGAGATIFGHDDSERGLLSTHLHSDGNHWEVLCAKGPSCRLQPSRIRPHMLEDGTIFPQMKGRHVFKHAARRLPEVALESLTANGVAIEDVDHWFFHQANMRINEMAASQLGIPPVRVYHNIHKYGNISAGAIPALLDGVNREGKIKQGDLCCFAAFGSGFTWASALMRW